MTTTATPMGTAPLDQPLYGATIGQAASRFWLKYATFSGRASRSEFWWWYLVNLLANGVLHWIGMTTSDLSDPRHPEIGLGYIPYALFGLATLIPNLAISWRRLHDTNRSGWWMLIALVPLVGVIVLLVFFILDSDQAGSRFDRGR